MTEKVKQPRMTHAAKKEMVARFQESGMTPYEFTKEGPYKGKYPTLVSALKKDEGTVPGQAKEQTTVRGVLENLTAARETAVNRKKALEAELKAVDAEIELADRMLELAKA